MYVLNSIYLNIRIMDMGVKVEKCKEEMLTLPGSFVNTEGRLDLTPHFRLDNKFLA